MCLQTATNATKDFIYQTDVTRGIILENMLMLANCATRYSNAQNNKRIFMMKSDLLLANCAKRCFSLIIRRKSYDTRWITLEKSPICTNCAKRHSLHKIWGYISNYTERFTLCGLIIADCATRGFSLIIQRNQNNTRGITLENSLTFENFATRYWYIMIRRVPVEINKRELMLEKS